LTGIGDLQQVAGGDCGIGVRALVDEPTTGKEAFGQAEKSFECQWLLLADFVRMDLEAARFPTPFQAEYEGSIPFTRSNVFRHFLRFSANFMSRASLRNGTQSFQPLPTVS
jgi:hypothetical protein